MDALNCLCEMMSLSELIDDFGYILNCFERTQRMFTLDIFVITSFCVMMSLAVYSFVLDFA